MSDPEVSIWNILKPPQGFEEWMHGNSVLDIPIAMIPELKPRDNSVILTDMVPENAGPNWDPKMIRYLPVPLGSTVLIWFPRIKIDDGQGGITETTYKYELRWRLRSLADRLASKEQLTYSMAGLLGPRTSRVNGTDPNWSVPACVSHVIEPAMPSNYVATGLFVDHTQFPMADSQGIYGNTAFPTSFDVARQASFFPPVSVPAVGDSLCIYAYRAVGEGTQTWDFDTSDAGFSLYYGVGRGSVAHPWYPSQGIYVCTMTAPSVPYPYSPPTPLPM